MSGLSLIFAGLISVATYGAIADGPAFTFPQIARFGGIVRTPDAAERLRRGAKIIFDIVADSKPDEINKGLESVARYLNLNAEAGHKPTDVKLALALHGSTTKAALGDTA